MSVMSVMSKMLIWVTSLNAMKSYDVRSLKKEFGALLRYRSTRFTGVDHSFTQYMACVLQYKIELFYIYLTIEALTFV